jgi:hypothetical protein
MNAEINTEEHNTRETLIYMVILIWATSTEKYLVLPLFPLGKSRDKTYNTYSATSS